MHSKTSWNKRRSEDKTSTPGPVNSNRIKKNRIKEEGVRTYKNLTGGTVTIVLLLSPIEVHHREKRIWNKYGIKILILKPISIFLALIKTSHCFASLKLCKRDSFRLTKVHHRNHHLWPRVAHWYFCPFFVVTAVATKNKLNSNCLLQEWRFF